MNPSKPVISPDLLDQLKMLHDLDAEFDEQGFGDKEERGISCKVASPHWMADNIADFEKICAAAAEAGNTSGIREEDRDVFSHLNMASIKSAVEGLEYGDLYEYIHADSYGSDDLESHLSTTIIWAACAEMLGMNPDEEDNYESIEGLIKEYWSTFFDKANPPQDHPHANAMAALDARVAPIMRHATKLASRMVLDSLQSGPFYLHANHPVPAVPGKELPAELSCHLYFDQDHKCTSTMDDAVLLQYYGVWTYQTPEGQKIACIANGSYFICLRDTVSKEDLLAMAAINKFHLGDITQHLAGDFVSSQNMTWDEYMAKIGRLGFATAHLYVLPEFSGGGLSELMLKTIADMTANPVDTTPALPAGYPGGARPSSICAKAPIRVFVMAVEGVPPRLPGQEELSEQSITEIEKRREKLVPYFEALSNDRYAVTTYNPWDYSDHDD